MQDVDDGEDVDSPRTASRTPSKCAWEQSFSHHRALSVDGLGDLYYIRNTFCTLYRYALSIFIYLSINWRLWPLCSADSGQWDSASCHTDRRYQCLQWHCNERNLHLPSGRTQTGIAESQRLRACQFIEAFASNLFHRSHHLLTKSYRVFGKGGPVLSSWSPSSITC